MKKVFKLDISAITIFAFVLIKSRLTIEAFTLFTTTLFAIINASFAMRAKSILINFMFDTIETLFSSINQTFIKYNNLNNVIFYDAIKTI